MPELIADRRHAVLGIIKRESDRIASRIRITEPFPIYNVRGDAIRRGDSLQTAAVAAGWGSLVVIGEIPFALVDIGETENAMQWTSTAYSHIPIAFVDALRAAEHESREEFTLQEAALLKFGQVGVMAAWLARAGIVVPMRLRSPRHGLSAGKVYSEESFRQAALALLLDSER